MLISRVGLTQQSNKGTIVTICCSLLNETFAFEKVSRMSLLLRCGTHLVGFTNPLSSEYCTLSVHTTHPHHVCYLVHIVRNRGSRDPSQALHCFCERPVSTQVGLNCALCRVVSRQQQRLEVVE